VTRALLVAALAAGCATAQPKPRPYPTPAASELLDALKRRQTALRTTEMETRTTSWLGGDRVRATVLMMVDRAGRLRFEAEVAVQGTVAALAVDRRNFTYLDYEHKLFRHGPACPANVALMVPIPLLPDEIAAILLGDAPLGEGARATEVGWDGQRQTDVLAIERAGSGAAAGRLWVSMRRGSAGYDVLGVEGQSPGAPASARWRVSYEDLGRADGGTLPALIKFAEPGKSFDDGVEIKVKERMGVNRPLRDEAFALTAPAGYRNELLACQPPAVK
jgi:hypothetical protein